MMHLLYQVSKIIRFLIVLILVYLFITHAPFPSKPPTKLWSEVPILIVSILMALSSLHGYWTEEVGDVGMGSYRSGLLWGTFGLILSGYIILRLLP